MIDFGILDISVIGLYFILVFGVAIWAYINRKESSSEEYFLAGRHLGWFVIGASLFASNIGSEHLIGLAGSGASSGVAVAHFEILASFILLLLGWFFVPFYIKSGVVTMPEFLEKRYSSGARLYLSIVSVIAYVITKISVTIYAGAVVFEAIGVPFWTGAIIIVVATGLYTVFGGLKAVIYTDMIQMIIMVSGSIFVTFLSLKAIGGIGELKANLDPELFNMWKSANHPDFPWTGILFGAPILGIWYWCTDQFIVQRVLSAKNISQARKGTIFAGILKILPLFIFVIPGMLAVVLSKKGMLNLPSNDQALPALMASILPVGLKGLAVASLLAALMSSLSSVFNSCSTLITYDFYKHIRPKSSEKKLIIVGQISTGILVIIGILWIPLMKLISGQLYTYIQSVQAYISPPIAAIFLVGILWRRVNATGAMASLITGFILGITRLILELNKDILNAPLHYIATINFLHFAIILFTVSLAVLIIVSLLTKKPNLAQIEKLTVDWKSKFTFDKNSRKDLKLSFILVIVILFIWYIFS